MRRTSRRAGGGEAGSAGARFRGGAAVVAVLALAYALTTTLPFEPRPEYLDTWGYSALLISASLLALARPFFIRENRPGWLCVALAVTSWAFGDILWQIMFGGSGGGEIPVPSPADPFYIGMYPLAYAGLILLARSEVRRLPASVWLDGLVTSFAAGAVFAAVSLNTVLATGAGAPLAQTLTNLLYPVGDLVLVVVAFAVLTMVRWRPDPVWWLLGAGAALFVVADTAYLLGVASHTYHDGSWIDGLWTIGLGFMAISGTLQRRREAQEIRGFAALIVPIVFSLCALAVLVVGAFVRLHPISIVLAGGCLVAAGARTALTFEQTRELAKARATAETDELSGIGNRRMLDSRLPAMIAELRPGWRLVLTIVSVDHVSEINGILGYSAGDTVLNTVGERLSERLPRDAICARLGGVEVAVLRALGDCDAQTLARDTKLLLAELATPVPAGQMTVDIEMSAGVAIAPTHASTPTDLIRCAADALRSAKANRSEVELFDTAIAGGSRFGASLLRDLSRAIEERNLVTYYAPKVDIRSGRPLAMESVARWHHPTRGAFGPEEMYPFAARVGLTRRLTRFLLDSALASCAQWRQRGVEVGVAVDVGAPDVLDASLPYDVARLINKWGVPPSALTIELPEEVLLIDGRRTENAFDQFRHFGIRLALDHYGKSAPSLTRLRSTPVDELKLDPSFVGPILTSPQDAAVVRSTVDIATSLGIATVVQGVESPELLDAAAACGCAGWQGGALGEPMTFETACQWLLTVNARYPAAAPSRTLPTSAPPAPPRTPIPRSGGNGDRTRAEYGYSPDIR